MLKSIVLTLLALALVTTPINAQGDTDVEDVITLKNLALEVLDDGDLLIRFNAGASVPVGVKLQRSAYAISFWNDSNQDPENPNITTISSTSTSDNFRLNRSESLSINSWCSNVGTRSPVLMSLNIELLGMARDGSEVFREVKVFHIDVSGKVEKCANR